MSDDATRPPRVDLMIFPDGRQFLFQASRPEVRVQVPEPKSPDDFVWSRAFAQMRRAMEDPTDAE